MVYDINQLIAKLGDFSIARIETCDSSISLSHHCIGESEGWQAPEQLRT